MKLRTRALGVCLLATLAGAAAIGSGTAAAATSPVVGHVYVNDDTAGTNTIAGFDRHADGTLTPMTGSPFPAGGAGAGSGLASQGALQVAAGGRLLLAVDPGSNQISVLRIRARRSAHPDLGTASCRRTASSRSASRFTEASSTSPTAATAAATTPGSGWGSSATCGTCGGIDREPARRLAAGRRAVQLDRHQPGRHARRHLADRQLRVTSTGRLARGTRLALRRPGPRPVRQRVSAHQPTPAVRLQRPRRRQPRYRVGLRRGRQRRPVVDRILALRGPPDGAVLGRDQPRRQLPVHRQHRRAQHLAVPDRGRRLTDAARQHRVQPAHRPRRRWTHGSRPTAARCGWSTPARPWSAGSA